MRKVTLLFIILILVMIAAAASANDTPAEDSFDEKGYCADWGAAQPIAETFEGGTSNADRKKALAFFRNMEVGNGPEGKFTSDLGQGVSRYTFLLHQSTGGNMPDDQVRSETIIKLARFLPRYIDQYHGNRDGFLDCQEHLTRAAMLDGENAQAEFRLFYYDAIRLKAFPN